LKLLCRDHSLPQPQFNVNVAGYELDAYWPDANLAVEIDGARTHHTRRAFHEDRARDRRLATQGIRVVRVTWLDLDDEASLAAELRAIRTAPGSSAAA
jgi:very-short-patch-repair endonuclease